MSHSFLKRIVSLTVALSTVGFLSPAFAQSSFPDVSEKDQAAVEFVKARGIMQGYADPSAPLGTSFLFKPKQKLTRAESVKILVATKLSAEEIQTFTKRSYTDVPETAWYRPYVEAAFHKLGLIDGPPKTTVFNGDRPVQKVEFLKLLFKSQNVDTNAYSEIALPLAVDVTDTKAWFYPAMRYAVSTVMIYTNAEGKLRPEAELTRAEAAELLYLLAMYQAGKRTQAGLTTEETYLVQTLESLDKKDFAQADMASARALLTSRGALTSKPTTAIVQAAVKIAEAFRALVRAYRAGTEGRLDDVLTLSKEAWGLADRAQQLSASLADLSLRVKDIASGMANQAREMIKQSLPPS